MLADEAIDSTTEFSRGRPVGERRLLLEHLEHLEAAGFTIALTESLTIMRDAGEAAGALPVPRMQLRWDGNNVCHYEMILRLSKFDVRRESRDENGSWTASRSQYMAVPMGRTEVSGGGSPVYEGQVSPPHRDGSHALWDAAQLNLPCYAICGDAFTRLEVRFPSDLAKSAAENESAA